MYTYNALITRVIDGDTVEALVDLGFHITHTIRVRLLNVHAPELFTGDDRQNGLLAKEHLEQLCLGRRVSITTDKDRMSFNRYVATIMIEHRNINEEIAAYCNTLL